MVIEAPKKKMEESLTKISEEKTDAQVVADAAQKATAEASA